MSEWWTYRLSSFLLFSPHTWFRLHELYNGAIWPLQLVAVALGVAIAVLAGRCGGSWRGRGVAALLAACWAFVAWGFHYRHYATINWAAGYFAVAFAIEALLLAASGLRGSLVFPPESAGGRVGMLIFAFALIAQPAIGPLLGRPWSQAEFFGVAPDPTAVATLGILLASGRPLRPLLVIPLLWCAVSGAFQWAMGLPDALVAPAAAAAVVVLACVRTRPSRSTPR